MDVLALLNYIFKNVIFTLSENLAIGILLSDFFFLSLKYRGECGVQNEYTPALQCNVTVDIISL